MALEPPTGADDDFADVMDPQSVRQYYVRNS